MNDAIIETTPPNWLVDNTPTTIEEVLQERGQRYGDFLGHAAITQELKRAMHRASKWHDLSDDKKEALEMIAHKIGRILNGDPEYHDSWFDIIGYSKLVADVLKT